MMRLQFTQISLFNRNLPSQTLKTKARVKGQLPGLLTVRWAPRSDTCRRRRSSRGTGRRAEPERGERGRRPQATLPGHPASTLPRGGHAARTVQSSSILSERCSSAVTMFKERTSIYTHWGYMRANVNATWSASAESLGSTPGKHPELQQWVLAICPGLPLAQQGLRSPDSHPVSWQDGEGV